MLKHLILILACFSLVSAISWKEYVALPLDQKYCLQYLRISQVANGSLANQYMSKNDALKLKDSFNLGFSADTMAKSRLILVNLSLAPTYIEPKMIKVGDHYVSETICISQPSLCQVAPIVKVNQTQTVVYARTAAQCVSAREKDWKTWCYIMESGSDKVDCNNAPSASKNQILDNIAKNANSEQGKCLRGY